MKRRNPGEEAGQYINLLHRPRKRGAPPVDRHDRRAAVNQDEVRALLGVMSGELNTSKGILTTTSDFAPRLPTDPFIRPFLPTRLELRNGAQLKRWLINLMKQPTH
jgi:hypothetical protein